MTYSTIIDKMWTGIAETVPYLPLRRIMFWVL